ncbi:tetratricopeptide repeat protein [Mariniblastus fucicola]|uniref:Uncharacterized protein n=1 Tax=Mariniblastus fucicola TaxID=980251 RepID=A0A5B9PA04_9BACT|nr:tetratricopeptide repeat protein [Mariniblastus fucicola]QEG23178.1 hypothetical protein MFFC18_30740 [Mariniblastus fucicola]
MVDTFRFAVVIAVLLMVTPVDSSYAQKANGFSKSGRGSRPATASSSPRSSGQGQGSASRGNRGNSNQGRGNRGPQRGSNHNSHGHSGRGHNSSGRGNYSRPTQQFNHHSFYSSRGPVIRYSFTPSYSLRGHYLPVVPYGYSDYPYGYGPTIYQDPYASGYGYSSGYPNYNPAYSTYGSHLNAGVLSSNVVGSSVAAQALERLRNEQAIVPMDQGASDARDAEILRLQIELERAKQALANQNAPGQQQTLLKPPVEEVPAPDPIEVEDQLGLAPIIETNQLAAASHLKAERAFRTGDYGQAARFAGLAQSLDESNGKLMLFAAQAHFANGEYREAAQDLTKANSLLSPEEMCWVVENFKLFYGKNDFVTQVKNLSAHLKQEPNDARAWLLRGYQYCALGHHDAARKDLNRARDLGASAELTATLLQRCVVDVLDQ